jgi:fucose 4-O-acetylase-like acetyltransferase
MTQPIERLHSLDFLRGAMMFLGILLHRMLPFMETPVPFWPAQDDDRSPLVDLLVIVVHDFRMRTFFFLAGFFGCLLYQRHGLTAMLQALWLLGN